MKSKLLLLFALFSLGVFPAFAQCPTDVVIIFRDQEDVDNFPSTYPGCKELTSQVIISGPDITNLNGLSALTSVARLSIDHNNVLTNLAGLGALKSIGGDLVIIENPLLANINNLNALKNIENNLVIEGNPALLNVNGLDALTRTKGGVSISTNTSLTNLDGLIALINVGQELIIENNTVLNNISGLRNVAVSGMLSGIGLRIINNAQLSVCNLPNFCAYLADGSKPRTISGNLANCLNEAAVTAACSATCLAGDVAFYTQADIDNFGVTYSQCTSISGALTINGNDITNVLGLRNITSITGNLNIGNNPVLTSLDGLNKVTEVGGYVNISFNAALTNVDGLNKLDHIGNGLLILVNAALANLDGLIGLTSVTDILLLNNPALTDIKGLQSVNSNSLTGIAGLSIIQNSRLAACDLPNFCAYLADASKPREIRENLSNCLNEVAVTAACSGNCPLGNFTFFSQSDLNSFGTLYALCTDITLGNVVVAGPDITDLSALSHVIKIDGKLEIRDNPLLVNLNGLNNVTGIGAGLTVSNNAALTSIDALSKVTTVGGGLLVHNNSSLIQLNGLGAITSIGGALSLVGNAQLSDITDLWRIAPATITGSGLTILNNPVLSFCNLSNFCVYLSNSSNLRNISGNKDGCSAEGYIAQGCTCPTTGDFLVHSQSEIDDFEAAFAHCPNIKLTNLLITGSDVVNLNGLRNVKGVKELAIGGTALTNLNSLTGLTSVNGGILIMENPFLTSITGLKNVDPSGIHGDIGLQITNNAKLSACVAPNICTYLAYDSSTQPSTISGNLGACMYKSYLQQACELALPITLADFTAVNEGRVNVLAWHNATEDPGDLVKIEHSVNGRSFRPIGTIVAKGIPDSRYSFVHENPAVGINYYRLHIVNMDGSQMYSRIVVAKVKEDGFVMNAYPNPFTGTIQVSLGKASEKAQITVSDMSGKILLSEPVNGKTHSLSLEHLNSGVYFIRYRDGGVSETMKMVK
jgi:hypothetical protein